MIQIGKRDILWNYGATLLKVASSALLLPFILRMMPSEMVGIWSIFMTITAFAAILDFGFSSSFTRNVTYVFSGVKKLKVNGFELVPKENQSIDYGLLKGVYTAMKWYYLRMAAVLFLLLSSLGTIYINSILHNYKGDLPEVYISWAILCLISTYNLYTLYYESLLQGKGLIKKSKQIVIIGQSTYIIISIIFIISGFGLVAIVSAQAVSIVIIRWLSHHSFFTSEIKEKLHNAIPRSQYEVLKAIYPNAVKMGLSGLGLFLVLKSASIIGSLYLPLVDIASYGITMQLISVIASLSAIYTATYQPKIAQLRIDNNNNAIKELYIKGQIIFILTYIIGGLSLLLLGNWALETIGSQTCLMTNSFIFCAIIVSFLESNHSIAAGILLSKNEVPFFKPSLIFGGATLLLLVVFFQFTTLGIWSMIAAPGIAQAVYQNWKWPLDVIRELKITLNDIKKLIRRIYVIGNLESPNFRN